MIIKIEMKPALFNFVRWHDGIDEGEPLKLKSASPIALALTFLVINKTKYLKRSQRPIPKSYSNRLSVEVNDARFLQNEYFLPSAGIITFNTFVYHLLIDTLLKRIEYIQSHSDRHTTPIMYEFLEELNILDLVAIDTIKKAILRKKQTRKNEYDLLPPKTFQYYAP